jgi:hypothetical protein
LQLRVCVKASFLKQRKSPQRAFLEVAEKLHRGLKLAAAILKNGVKKELQKIAWRPL